MAQTILKKTPAHVVVKAYGAATETFTLASFATAGQTPSSPKANIRRIRWIIPTAGTATISRNAVVLYSMGPGVFDLPLEGFADTDGNTSDLVITVAGNATVIVELAKVSGWGNLQASNQVA